MYTVRNATGTFYARYNSKDAAALVAKSIGGYVELSKGYYRKGGK